jgi:hypothetical protein
MSNEKEKLEVPQPMRTSQPNLKRGESSELHDNTDLIIQIAANALIAEYNAMRAASLSRDQIFSAVASFGIALMVAILASLPTVISQQRYQLLLPFFSFLASSLALANMSQRWLLETLACYENDELAPRLRAMFDGATRPEMLPDGLNRYWQWQAYLKSDRNKGSFLYRVSKSLSGLAPSLLPLLASLGFIFLFIYHHGLSSLTIPESILFYLAVVYGLLTLLVYFVFLQNRKKRYT